MIPVYWNGRYLPPLSSTYYMCLRYLNFYDIYQFITKKLVTTSDFG